jgi:hypothetical protein
LLVCTTAVATTSVQSTALPLEVYAIYSAMLTSPLTQQAGASDEIYLIDAWTTDGKSRAPSCPDA